MSGRSRQRAGIRSHTGTDPLSREDSDTAITVVRERAVYGPVKRKGFYES